MSVLSYRSTVLAASTLAFFVTMAGRLTISPVVPAIEATFAISNAAVGLALSGMWVAYASAQFPSGLLADRFGERTVILVSVLGTGLASVLVAVAPVYAVFLVGATILGGLAGLHYSVATTLLTRTFESTGSAIGIHSAGAPVAGIITPVAAGTIGSLFGWRYAVLLGAVAAIPVFGLFAVAVEQTPPLRPQTSLYQQVRQVRLVAILTRDPITRTLGLAVLGAFAWQATASFLPAFLINYHEYSTPLAGTVFAGYFAVQGVGQPAIGALSDRVGRYPAAAVAAGAGTVGYPLFVLRDSLPSVVMATVLIGIAMSWGAALLPKFIDHLSDAERSTGFGLVRTTYMVIGASGSVVIGWVADTLGWGIAFFVLAGLLACMLLATIVATVRY